MSKLSTGPRIGLLAGAARAAILLGLTTALAGCYSARPIAETRANDNYPNDVRQRHPIAIREGERTLEVFVGANRGGLTPAQRADVLAFAHRWGREATGGIVIQVPAGASNEAAAAGVLREIQSILAAAGVPPRAVVARRYRPADPMQLATVRVIYPKMIAEAGPCGLWPHDIGPSLDGADFQNREYWNFGCANQRNLAAMVENPADLVQPRGDAPVYAARRSTVLEKYRKGEDPSAKSAADKDGKISDVGK
jgi:pilus assembly protein CpaD